MNTLATEPYASTGGVAVLGLPFAVRVALLAGALIVLAGCTGPIERRTPASGFPAVLNAEEMADQGFILPLEERSTPTYSVQAEGTPLPQCMPTSSSYRVRDLSVPWAQRRYLTANGTVCTPNPAGVL